MFTNGLVRDRTLDLDDGFERLLELAGTVPADAAHDPGEILDYLIAGMIAGRERDDDIAAIAVTRASRW